MAASLTSSKRLIFLARVAYAVGFREVPKTEPAAVIQYRRGSPRHPGHDGSRHSSGVPAVGERSAQSTTERHGLQHDRPQGHRNSVAERTRDLGIMKAVKSGPGAVTDVFWHLAYSESSAPDARGAFFKITLAEPGEGPSVFDPLVYQSQTVPLVATGHGVGGSEPLTTGFVVGPKAQICANAHRTDPGSLGSDFIVGKQIVILHGDLTKGNGSPPRTRIRR